MSTPPRTGTDPATREEGGFNSKLSAPRERFLAAIVEHALLVGRRTAKDFLKAFPAREIMNALRDQPRLRAKILVTTTGINEKVALKKPASSAGEDLEIALGERVAEEDDVVALFDPDDRVRFLDHGKLWAFLIEGEFWRITADHVPVSVAREHIAYILSRARAEKLIADRDIIDGLTLDVLVESLPKEELGRVIERALSEGRAGRVFKDERVLDVLSPYLLVEHVSLAHIWHRLIERLSFKSSGTTTTTSTTSQSAVTSAPPAPPSSSPSLTVGETTISEPSLSAAKEKESERTVAAEKPKEKEDKDGKEDAAPISVKLDLANEEEIIIDDDREDEITSNEVDALLAKVVVSESSQMSDRPTLEAAKADSKEPSKENGARSQRPSRPPPA